MANEQDVRNPENNENDQSDELAPEELDQVVGAGGKQNTPPPDKPVPYVTFTLTDGLISS